MRFIRDAAFKDKDESLSYFLALWFSGYNAALSRQRSWVRVPLESLNGVIAQLGEHLPCKQGVESSNLFNSITIPLGKYYEKRGKKFD